MLETNPMLTPREIAHILVDTADFLISKTKLSKNGAGYYFDERVFYFFLNSLFLFLLFVVISPQFFLTERG